MGSLTRHSLEQIEVAAGTLAPEQTLQIQSGRLDGKRPAEGCAEGRD